jgi:hypothetical protein
MGQPASGIVGPQTVTDGQRAFARYGRQGDHLVSELHGRFYEQVARGNVYSFGTKLQSLPANAGALDATSQPVLAVWNPPGSGLNLAILQIALASTINTFTTPAGYGMFVLASSTGNTGPLANSGAGFSRKTLSSGGGQGRGWAMSANLTGLTNNLVIFQGLGELTCPSSLTYGTIVAPTSGTTIASYGGVANIDGSIIVQPGTLLAVLIQAATTTFSVGGSIMWEEVPS